MFGFLRFKKIFDELFNSTRLQTVVGELPALPNNLKEEKLRIYNYIYQKHALLEAIKERVE